MPNYKTESFKANLMTKLDSVRDMIETMPSKGDVKSECQRLCLLNAVYEVDKNINGICDEDLKPN